MANIYRIQAYDWIMCRYFCIGVYFMLKGKGLLEYTNFFLLMTIKTMIKFNRFFSIIKNMN